MPKYYIQSGSLQFIVTAPGELEAIQMAIAGASGTIELGQLIRVSEQGFNRHHEEDVYFDTMIVLEGLETGNGEI